MSFKKGDWVVITPDEFVPLDLDASTYPGMPCIIHRVDTDREIATLYCPLKVCYGKPPWATAPFCQLLKIDFEEGDRFIRQTLARDTSESVRIRCSRR